jgi:hypothetical protein
MSVAEVAADAAELLRLGDLARLAIELQLPPEIHFRRADAIARRYGASVSDIRALHSTVMAVRFQGSMDYCPLA